MLIAYASSDAEPKPYIETWTTLCTKRHSVTFCGWFISYYDFYSVKRVYF